MVSQFTLYGLNVQSQIFWLHSLAKYIPTYLCTYLAPGKVFATFSFNEGFFIELVFMSLQLISHKSLMLIVGKVSQHRLLRNINMVSKATATTDGKPFPLKSAPLQQSLSQLSNLVLRKFELSIENELKEKMIRDNHIYLQGIKKQNNVMAKNYQMSPQFCRKCISLLDVRTLFKPHNSESK